VTSERKAHLRELLMENRKNVLRSSADAAVQENRVESGHPVERVGSLRSRRSTRSETMIFSSYGKLGRTRMDYLTHRAARRGCGDRYALVVDQRAGT
jgi:hypothetical protein